MLPNYKRSALAATAWRRLHCSCFACLDTGIVSNSDALLNETLPQYDITADGRRAGGSDLALICHCSAAFAEPPGPDGKPPRLGFRDSSGDIIKVSTTSGLQALGAEVPKTLIQDLHRRRLERWRETEKVMAEALESKQPPWFLAEVKAYVKTIPPRKAVGGLQPISSILAAPPSAEP